MDVARLDLDHLCQVAASTDGVLRRAHLTRSGLSTRDITWLVRRGVLVRLQRDTYRIPSPDDPPQADFHATVRAVRRRNPTRILTGAAAVAELGLPVFGRPSRVDVVHDPRGGASTRSVLRTVARPPDGQLTLSRHGPVATPARAVLDAARLEGVVAGVVAADAALRAGATSLDELSAVAATMAGLRGADRARRCALLAHPGSQSPGESWSAVVLDDHLIPAPDRQVEVRDDAGRIGVVDFSWRAAGVVGEFDGRVKYGRVNPAGQPPEEVVWREKLREDRLRATGLAVVRWTTSDLRTPGEWVRRTRRALGI
ncbi:type IV toxin-antitoxin system AbiEi family antitoxin domain-containing protein [Actinotalea solisilvae]|uniref:type IV toxin-antitoxin system AbiEi family antitoxin domain-containing protein n=1 Tax=Actinotalea solisilvae TaxID=2072922 RepID=UPI0018F10DB7|nr:type IV toxin-antitoxin system AbiEi family antitoxin domain-containing protein [Actinotalea solisilvae]